MHKKIYRADRKLGINLFEKPNSPVVKRSYPPGQHGKGSRKRQSNYARRLIERQKLRALYNIKSSALDIGIMNATSKKKPDLALIASLEQRLDRIVYRLGFAPTSHSARQLVSHKHFLVNDLPVNIPSYKVKPGDKISVKERSRGVAIVNRTIESAVDQLPPYLKKESDFVGFFARLPENKDELRLHFNINPTAVIESLR